MNSFDAWFMLVGQLVCLLSGLALSTLLFVLTLNYCWQKFIDAKNLVAVTRCWRKYGQEFVEVSNE